MTRQPLKHFLLEAATLVLFCACGCGGPDWDAPPEIRLGRDECAECGMMINEDRCSAAALVERQGRREHVLFDDVGCLLDFDRRVLLPNRVEKRFFRDFEQRKWLTSDKALFVMADREKLITPMASGIVAVERASDADRIADSHLARVVTWNELVNARKAWTDARRAPSTGHH